MQRLFTKKLGYGEVKYKLILIPKRYRGLVPQPLQPFDIEDADGTEVYTVHLDNQYRFYFSKWFNAHPRIKEGDEVSLSKENGRHVIKHLPAGRPSDTPISIPDVIGKIISKGKVVGVKYKDGKTLVEVQQIKEFLIDDIIDELR